MVLRLGIVLWLAAVAAGFGAWEAYDRTPGAGRAQSAAGFAPTGRPSVVVFVHPRCPCSRATFAELDAAASDAAGGFDLEIVFVRPDGVAAGWERTGAWDAAEAVRGARVSCDIGGVEARAAGAETSGDVVARDAGGAVVFRGGVTWARGRAGDNPGRRAVAAVLAGRSPEVAAAPVFGCPLFAAARCCSDSANGECSR